MSTIRIFDTTLRDGEQTPGVHFSPAQKVDIAQALEAYGVTTIEAGFPDSSPGDAQAVAAVAAAVHCEVAALARCVEADITAAAAALRGARQPVIHIVLGASNIHLEHKLKITRARALRIIEQAVRTARNHTGEIEFSLEDATRAEPQYLRQCIETAIEAGATRINIADTVGCATPEEFGPLIRDIVQFTGGRAIISAHCHNDLGLATANTVAAIRNGARQVEVTINGLGERAGNAAAEEVAAIAHLKGYGYTGIQLDRTAALSAMVAAMSGIAVQANRAIAGANAFTHSSGIHQDGILKHPANYEFVSPALVGVPGHTFLLTARSGRNAIAHIARKHNIPLTSADLDIAYTNFLAEADQTTGAVPEERVVTFCQNATQTPARC